MSEAIFIPAIGEQLNSVWKRGLKYTNKDGKEFDMRFFTKESFFSYKYGLQSCYYGINGVSKKQRFRNMISYPDNNILIGDSGGFQIASFKKRGEVCNITAIDSLRWQEDNCDIGMNMDVPPNLDGNPSYEQFVNALDESVENFKIFEKDRKNYKMKLYNVLHGETLALLDIWYNKVKDFKFEGWAVGIKPPFDPMLQALGFLFLYEKGELTKDSCYGVHFFGTSGKHVCPTIVYLASKLNNKFVSYDSSSYNIGSIYRTYYMPFEIGDSLSFGEKFKVVNPLIKALPCMCPVCVNIKNIEELNTTDIYAGTLISLHNLYQYVQYNNILNSLVHDKEKFLAYLKSINISEKTLKSIEFIDYALDKGLVNAVNKYEQWLLPQELDKSKQVNIFNF